ncbi:MAG: BatA domain-containing protein, partial [Deltaproteobacteria bacterium]|nr:BatA domain-containing protein [Deltaproteobacteria bacterium]
MNFTALSPWIVAALSGATVLFLLISHWIRPQPRPFIASNIAFWKKAIVQSAPPKWKRGKIPWLSLLLAVFLGVGLVLFAGAPEGLATQKTALAIVIDAGWTMGALTRGGMTRFERALKEAAQIASSEGGQLLWIRAGTSPELLPEIPKEEALDRLQRQGVDDAPSAQDLALELADGMLSAHSQRTHVTGRIVYIGDHEPRISTHSQLEWVRVGIPVDTVAITSFCARRLPHAAGEYLFEVEVSNHSNAQASFRLQVQAENIPLFDQTLTLGPREKRLVGGVGSTVHAARLLASITEVQIDGSRDSFSGDDRSFAVIEALRSISLLWVGSPNPFLQALLETHPLLRVTHLSPTEFSKFSKALNSYDILLFDRVNLSDAQDHPAIITFGMGSVDEGKPSKTPSRIDWVRSDHPIVEGIDLLGVSTGRTLPLHLG